MNKRYHFVFACFRQIVTFLHIIIIGSAISLAALPPVSTMLSNGTPSSKLNAALINIMGEILQPLQWLGGAPRIAKAAPPAQTVVTVGLQGRGIALLPEIDISSLNVGFGSVELGDVVTRTLTIRNLGTAPLLMSSLSLGGADVVQFSALDGTCGLLSVSLAAGASCTVKLTFHPSSLGILNTTLSVLSNDLDELLTLINLSGTGIPVPAPEIAVSTLGVNFGSIELGDVVTRTLTISNLGDAPLLMTSLSLGGADVVEFSALNGSCGLLSVSLAAGTSCTVDLTFHPSLLGVLTTTLSIVSNDLNELLTLIDLSGTGIPVPAPEIAISTLGINFGSVELGDAVTRTLTISNLGDAPLLMTSLSLGGADVVEFSALDGSCGLLSVSLAAGDSCIINLTFHPSLLGVLTTTLSIASNDLDELLTLIDLSGTGIPVPAPEIAVSALGIDFGNVELGDVVTRTLTISNLGNAPLLMTTLSLGGADVIEFNALDGTCGLLSVSLAAGASCTVDLTFHPSLLGVLTTTLSIMSNDLDELLTLIDLSGTGIPVPAPEIAVSVLDIDFGSVELGDVVTRTLTISNLGDAPLLMTSLSLGGADVVEFSALDGSCGLLSISLAAGDSCTINLTFHPSLLGVLTTTLSIVSNDLNELLTLIDLLGTGIPVPAPEIAVSTLGLDFGSVELGDAVTHTLTISNLGNAPLLMTSLSLGGADVVEFSALDGSCGLLSVNLAAGDSCTVDLTFHPSLLGVLTTTLSIVSNDLDELLTLIDLLGTGIPVPAPEIVVSPANLDFGAVDVGDVATRTLTISNTGNAPLLVSSIALSGTNALEFTVVGGTCGALVTTVMPGQSCDVQISFHPLTAGAKVAELLILNNDMTEPKVRIAFIASSDSPSPGELSIQINTPIAGDNMVNRNEVAAVFVSGQTQPDISVDLMLDDGMNPAIKATTTADSSGNYHATLDISTLHEGTVAVRATATAGDGRHSTQAVKQILKDTIVLDAVMISPANGALVLANSLWITGTGEVGGVVTILIQGQTLTSTVDVNGVWKVWVDKLIDQQHLLRLKITDVAGNSTAFIDGNTFTTNGRTAPIELDSRHIYLPLIQQ